MRRRAGDVLFVLGAAVLAAAFIRGAQTAADDAAARICAAIAALTLQTPETTAATSVPPMFPS